jgi:hypothetical protein
MNNTNNETNEIETLKSNLVRSRQTISQFPLLPRSAWQDRRAFLKVLIKAKRALDLAEISAFVDS